MKDSSTNDQNKFFKTVKVDGMTPYLPTAPAYCTRSSPKKMKEVSKALTERELQELESTVMPPLKASASKAVKCVPAIEFNPDMHRIMCRYADKQQQLCGQICELNQRLQSKHDEILSLKERHKQALQAIEDDLSHITEINEGNEGELEDTKTIMREQASTIVATTQKYKDIKHWQPFYILASLVLYSFLLFYGNHTMEWELPETYARLHNTTCHLIDVVLP